MRRRSGWIVVATAVAMVLGACGDDGGGGTGASSARLDDAAFCARAEAIEGEMADLEASGELTEEEMEQRALTTLAELADQAPTEELGDALDRIGAVVERLSAIDEDDPDAFGEAMALALDPEMIAAGERIETYFTETCGFDDMFGDDDSATDEPLGGDGGNDGSDDPLAESTGDASDDLDSSELREALRDEIELLAPDVVSSGFSIAWGGGTTDVEFSASGGEIDALGLCEALAAEVDARTTDPDVRIRIRLDDEDRVAAERVPGGTCTAT